MFGLYATAKVKVACGSLLTPQYLQTTMIEKKLFEVSEISKSEIYETLLKSGITHLINDSGNIADEFSTQLNEPIKIEDTSQSKDGFNDETPYRVFHAFDEQTTYQLRCFIKDIVVSGDIASWAVHEVGFRINLNRTIDLKITLDVILDNGQQERHSHPFKLLASRVGHVGAFFYGTLSYATTNACYQNKPIPNLLLLARLLQMGIWFNNLTPPKPVEYSGQVVISAH